MSAIPWLLVALVGSVWAGSIPGVALNGTLNLAFLGASRLFMPGALPAFNVAMRTIRERQLLPGYNIEWQYRDSQCNPYHGMYHESLRLKHHKLCDHPSAVAIINFTLWSKLWEASWTVELASLIRMSDKILENLYMNTSITALSCFQCESVHRIKFNKKLNKFVIYLPRTKCFS